ncbi:unnamed protein product [Scytosiphon promiscuus]
MADEEGCTSVQGDDCDDDTSPDWLVAVFFAYIISVGVMGVLISIMVIVDEYGRWAESESTFRTCAQNIVVKVFLGFVLALLWPFLMVYLVYYKIPRMMCAGFAGRLRRRPQEDQTVDVLQRVKIWAPGKWEHRGWLVMMRARHRRSSLRTKKSWLPWPDLLRPKQRQLTASAAVGSTFQPGSGTQGTGAGTPTLSELELAEAGRSDWNFARAVTAVVEMEEEGLFRSIVTYI